MTKVSLIKIKAQYHSTLKNIRPEGFRLKALDWVSEVFLKQFFQLSSHKMQIVDLTGVDVVNWHVVLCGAQKISSLNARYRKINKVTDVLSFPLFDSLRRGHGEFPLPSPLSLGEIYICVPKARKQAKEFHISLEQEILHLYTHGLLHLLGFDHEKSRREEQIMQNLENEIVAKIYRKAKY